MKVASEEPMGQMTSRMTIQEMIKAAASGAASQQSVTNEAIRQLSNQGENTPEEEEKTAAVADPDLPGEAVSSAYAEKLAAAIEYIVKEADEPSGASPAESGSATKQGPGDGPNAMGVMQATVSDKNIDAGEQGQATSKHQPPQTPATQTEEVQTGKANTGLETNDGMSHPEQPTEPIANEKASIKAAHALLQEKGFTTDFIREINKLGAARKYEAAHQAGEKVLGALRTYKSNLSGGKVKRIEKEMTSSDVPSAIRKGQEADLAAAKKSRDVTRAATAGGVGVAGGAAATGAALSKKEGSVDPRLIDALLATKQAAGEKVAEDAINPASTSAPSGGDAAAPPPGASASEDGPKPAEPSDVSSQKGMIASNDAAIDYTKRKAKADPKSDVNKVLTEPALTTATDKTLQKNLTKGTETAKISSAEATKLASTRALLEKLAAESADKAKKKKESQGFQAPGVQGAATGPSM
jgi:hypothetical protein